MALAATQRNQLLDPPAAARHQGEGQERPEQMGVQRGGSESEEEGRKAAGAKGLPGRTSVPVQRQPPLPASAAGKGSVVSPHGEGLQGSSKRRRPPPSRLLGSGLRSRALPPALPQRRPAGGGHRQEGVLPLSARPSCCGSAAAGNWLEKAAAVLRSAANARVFLGSESLDCDQVKKPAGVVLMEWTDLPREDPDYYIVTYQHTDAFSQKNVRNISKVEQKPVSTTILLEENKKYDITIESLKNGRIISVKSFKTRGISENDIKTFVTATTVSFNWSTMTKEFSVSVSLNDTSQIIKNPSGFFVWSNLTPATLYTFKFIFEQLHLEFINVSQSLDVQAETGTCSQGWVAFQSSCYRMGKESKPWKVAQQICETSSRGAHLLDIGSEEEHGFILSYLQTISQIIMLWTGLNDLKEEGQLLWTDGSPYLLKAGISTLSMIPENETDCYALQRDPTVPLVPENFTFSVRDVKTTEAVFMWSDMDIWLKSDFALIIKYYFDQWKPYILSLPVNTTQTKIVHLFPGLSYSFLLAARNPEGAQTILSPILKVETRPLHSQKLEATYVSSAEIHLKWKPPQHSSSASFRYYLINILDTETNIWEQLPVEKSKTSIVIENVKPYHQYQVYLQNVAEKGTLSCHEKPILITTAVSPPTAVYIHPEDVQEESVILHWKLPQEGQESYIQVKPNADIGETKKFLLKNTEEVKVDLLIPGMAYEIAVASVNNGNMSELKTIQCTLKPKPVQIVVPYVLYSNAVVLFVRMPDIGVFDGIYVTSKGGPNATFILKSDGKITIENLTAGTEYDFCVSTKSGKMLSSFYHVSGVKTCLAAPLNVREGNVTDTSIQIAWDRADGDFQQYEVTCTNCASAFRVQKVKQETATFSSLTPGKLYNFTIRTEKEGFRDSIFVTKEVETVPSAVKYLNYSRDSESVTVTWPPAQNMFDGYVISINSKVFNEEKMLPSGVRIYKFESLLPGTDFLISIVTTNGLKRSQPTILKINTYPDPPSDLQVFGQEENTVYFSWKPPRGGFDMFQAFDNILEIGCSPRMATLNPFSVQPLFVIGIAPTRVQDLALGLVELHEVHTGPLLELVQVPLDSIPSLQHVECTTQLGVICKLAEGALNPTVLVTNKDVKQHWSQYWPLRNATRHWSPLGHQAVDCNSLSATIQPIPYPPSGPSIKSTSLQFRDKDVMQGSVKCFAQVQLSYCLMNNEKLLTRTVYDTRAVVKNLVPGTEYLFQLRTVKGLDSSVAVEKKVITKPARPEGLKFFNVSSYSFSLYWRLPYGHVDRFHVDLIPDHGSVVILDLGVREYQADFSNTIPGTTYNVTVSAVSSSLYSSPASRTVTTNVTNPGPPVFLAGERVGSAGILLSWNTPLHPNGRILSYIVKYKEVCPWMQTAYTQVTTKPDSLEVLLTSLNPGTTYEITVAAENSAGVGVFSDPFLFQTAESAPGKVVNLTVEALNYSAVNLIWFLPRQPNGKITSFKISVKHARSGIVVKDVLVKVEDLLSGRLPECNDNSESFLWSTTTPSTTFGKSTIPSRTTVTPSTEAPSQMSSVWNEPISFVITNLRPYTTYLFEVSAVTTEAGYIDSAIVRTPESVPEDPPQNFAKSNITAKSFSVMWDPPTIVTGKFSYRVELYGPSGRILDNSTKDHKFVFSNLVPFTTYTAYVSAETSAGVGPKTNLTVFTPADGAVSDLHLAEVEATYIKIVWRKPRQPNGIITQYRVKVHVQETKVTLENTILTGKNKYLIDTLEPYMINENVKPSPTWNSMETADELYEGSAEMFPSIQTASPVIFTSVSRDNLPTINGAAELHSALDNQYTINILAEELSYVVKGLVPFTDYTISVSAFTAVGEGPPSVLTVRTREQVPGSVQNISYKNISSSSVLLYWDPPANPNGKIIHYTVYAMELDTKRAFHTTTSNNSLLMTGLKKYTNYKMRVAASTTIGESALSEENDVFVRTPEDEPDSPPQNVELINVTATEINLRWLPPEQPNGLITHYEVLYSDSNDLFIKNASSTSLSLSKMKPYTLYNISVRAFTRLGHGNQSSFPLLVRTSETVRKDMHILMSLRRGREMLWLLDC
ncbi:hypothetical protein QYF61_000376 [Mycteria americana]|uniref:Protein-tyrosine-phosphatase n=1 Tax=Mycteria americana TaxID=33587 RepID=A0AAN7NJJ4_MYCAM|nr:hypothetical protein QYF61_000376 [Mycteria americana]